MIDFELVDCQQCIIHWCAKVKQQCKNLANSYEIAEKEAWRSVQGTRKSVETSCICKYQDRNVRGDVSVRKMRDVGAHCSTVEQNEGRRRNSTYSLQVPVRQFRKYGLKKSPG
ncbi:hypothetical protein TNCV_3128231 [Trichonephila clavipes]|nr:hypothetical protein TNCV_3128231 [Trichonephila clavipes]